MQEATRSPPPWWPSAKLLNVRWPQLFYSRLAEERERRQRQRQRRQRERLTIYTYGNDDHKIRVVFSRVDGWKGRDGGGGGDTRPPPAWERFPHYSLDQLSLQPHQPVLDDLQMRMNVQWQEPSPPTHTTRFISAPTMRTWLLGTAVVAVVILIARAIDKCLGSKFIQSLAPLPCPECHDWPPPSVRITHGDMEVDGTVIISGMDDLGPLPSDLSDSVGVDLPPAYCECAAGPGVEPEPAGFANKGDSDSVTEEPPPYSDCYVEFSNKNGIPSVLIFSKKRTPPVDRRDITGTVIIDEETKTTEQNRKNTNMEVVNEAARIGEHSGEINTDKASDYARNTPGIRSSERLTVIMNGDNYTCDKEAPLLV